MIKGSIVALVTPFDSKNRINYKKLYELIDYHIKNKTDGLLLYGTTGEGSTLSLKEKIKIAKKAIKYTKNRIPIILNCGTSSTKETIRNCKLLSRLNPYALLVITPYYNKSNDLGMYLHFNCVAKESSVPIIIYNVPSRTNYDMPIETIRQLSRNKNIIGIKDATKNLEKKKLLANLQNDNFYWYSGNDELMIEDIKEGAKGLIGVVTNSHPKIVKKIITLALSNEYDLAHYYFLKIEKYIQALSLEVNPIPIKEAMNIFDWEVGGFRLPLTNLSKINKEHLLDAIGEIKL